MSVKNYLLIDPKYQTNKVYIAILSEKVYSHQCSHLPKLKRYERKAYNELYKRHYIMKDYNNILKFVLCFYI